MKPGDWTPEGRIVVGFCLRWDGNGDHYLDLVGDLTFERVVMSAEDAAGALAHRKVDYGYERGAWVRKLVTRKPTALEMRDRIVGYIREHLAVNGTEESQRNARVTAKLIENGAYLPLPKTFSIFGGVTKADMEGWFNK
jgi:hypothetical protein